MTKKILALIMAVFMLSALFVSCKKEGSEDDSESVTTAGGNIIEQGGDGGAVETEIVKDDIPDDLKYDGYEFQLICDEKQYPKSFVDTYTGDVINSALFERKNAVEQRLGIKLNIIRHPGQYYEMDDFIAKIVASGDTYDLMLAYNLLPASMAVQGLLHDLNDTKYLNFEKPWWSDTLIDKTEINGKLFFTADNSSWNNVRNMLGLFVNRSMFENNHPGTKLEDLYDMVDRKEWTMEKMFEFIKGSYVDNSASMGEVTADDTYGLSTGHSVWNESWFYNAGFTTVQKNSTGDLEFSLKDERVVNFFDYFTSKFRGNPDVFTYDKKQYNMFLEGRAMFYVAALSMVEQKIEFEYGVVPMPMYDPEFQKGYSTHFSNTYDMYGIPKACKDYDRASAVLECLASEAYRKIGPAYFEEFLKLQNSDSERLNDMYDTIRASIVFDMGCLYGELFVKDNNPVYFVRRVLNNVSGYDSLGAKWNDEIHVQYTGMLKKMIETISSMS